MGNESSKYEYTQVDRQPRPTSYKCTCGGACPGTLTRYFFQRGGYKCFFFQCTDCRCQYEATEKGYVSWYQNGPIRSACCVRCKYNGHRARYYY